MDAARVGGRGKQEPLARAAGAPRRIRRDARAQDVHKCAPHLPPSTLSPPTPSHAKKKKPRAPAADGKSDCELVAKLYADTLDGAFGAAETLTYEQCEWGDEEAVQLAKALPLARRATKLDIEANTDIGARGYGALADAFRAGAAPRLRTLKFDIEKKASIPLRKACEARSIQAYSRDPTVKAAKE